MALRAKLLTPLVAIDWISQIQDSEANEELQEIKKKACEVLQAVTIDPNFNQEWNRRELGLPKIPEFINRIRGNNTDVKHKDLKRFATRIEKSIEKLNIPTA